MHTTAIKDVITGLIVAVTGVFTATAQVQQLSCPAQPTRPAAATGVHGFDVVVGSGVEATPNSVVSVLYVGKLLNCTVFDSSSAWETWDDISLDGHTLTYTYTETLGKSDPKAWRLFSDAKRRQLVE